MLEDRIQDLNSTISLAHQSSQIKSEPQKTSVNQFFSDILKLYSYAQKKQKIAIIVGIVLGITAGCCHTLFLYLWFQDLNFAIMNQGNLKPYLHTFRMYLYYFIGLGFGFMLLNCLIFGIWKYISRSISKKIRIRYLQQFIKQNLVDVEKNNSYEWANEFKTHTLNIQKSIGDKIALLLNVIGIIASGLIAAMTIRWTFTFYMLILVPFSFVVLYQFIQIQGQKKKINVQSGKQAQDEALEATSMIKTVKMLNGEEKEALDYQQKLSKGEQILELYNSKLGLWTGLFFTMQYLFFGVGFLMGIQCVKGGGMCPVSVTGSRYKINQFLSVFFQIFFCTFNFLQLGANYTFLISGLESSKKIFLFIDGEKNQIKRQNSVDQHPPNDIKKIVFQGVYFEYPLHPQNKILKNLHLSFVPYKFNAIVGATGSGKSTIIQLLLKQYDPTQGQIQINSIDLKKINTSQWLDQVGVVTQEPVLFNGSIKENILVGKHDAKQQEITQILKQVKMYDFVESKSEGLNFEIGVGGSKLSGGQKQRIAIARALIKKPKLLILDEATSALDPQTQAEVQDAIQQVRKYSQNQITIVCIAHKIKTITNADKIFLLDNGSITQSGLFKDMKYFKKRQVRRQTKMEPKKNLVFSSQSLISLELFQTSRIMNHRNKSQKQTEIVKKKYIYSHLLSYTKHFGRYIFCLIAAVIISGIHLISATLISYHLNQLNKYFLLGTNTNWCDSLGNLCNHQLDQYFQQSKKYLYGLIGLAFFTFLPYFVQTNLLSNMQNQIAFGLKKNLFKKILSLQVKFFEQKENQSGGAITKLNNDCRDSSTLITTFIPTLLCNFCIAIGAVLICMFYEWRFGLLSIIVTPLISLSFYISMLFIGGYQDSSLQKLHKPDQTVNQLITTFKTVLVLNYQQRFFEKYKKQVEEPFIETIKIGGKIGLFYGLAFFTLDVVVGMSLYFSVVILSQNPEIKSISIIIYMIVSTFSGFIIGNNFYFISHISASKESAKRVMQIVNAQTQEDAQQKMRTKLVRPACQEIKGQIQFKNVSFKYNNDKLVMNNVNFTIYSGSKVAFVGCGKSTIIQLLLRFYQFEGQILLDGVNIFNYDLKQYRKIFSVLNQEPSLFFGTIEQNIAYNSQISKQTFYRICKNSCAYEINSGETIQNAVNAFKQRIVGPQGSNISGGQKQRVACARAFAKNGKIFLMDQGTSALDGKTEMDVLKGINQQFKGKTIINITHKIQVMQNIQEVLAFKSGQMYWFGTPKQYLQIVNEKNSKD